MAHEVLIVDDEADIRMLLSGVLEDEGYVTRTVAGSDEALPSIRQRLPSLVLLDIWLEGSRLDGMQVLELIQREYPGLPVVMISGHGNIETAVEAIKLGAYDFIEKPFKADRLLLVTQRAIENARLRRENLELRQKAGSDEDIVGESPATNHLRAMINRVAPTGSRVLITGPAGSGKEVVARLIHRQSTRAAGPFVILNCATMRPENLELELFGAEVTGDGENTGAKIGLFERAHGGTLFLDEISDMPLETQGKIVRALQDQTFTRVGGNMPVEVDVRVISSSNRNLAEQIEKGLLREDLFYRLNVVPIDVPPLRDRRDDISVLAEYFMKRASVTHGLPARLIGEDVNTALQSYDWPGNVRQLRNVVEWLLIMAPGETGQPLKADMLPAEVINIAPGVVQWERGSEIMALPLREAREMFERDYLLAQVTRFGGNISKTASFIGMERSALHRKLKLLGISQTEKGRGMSA
ncbi:MAG: sigma-54 dependent transcriptional regulator [Alphaproteobacteria bacterium]